MSKGAGSSPDMPGWRSSIGWKSAFGWPSTGGGTGPIFQFVTVKQIPVSGVNLTPIPGASGADLVQSGDRVLVFLRNNGGTDVTVTIDDIENIEPEAAVAYNPDAAIVVAAGTTKIVGPINHRFGSPSTGIAAVFYSAVGNMQIDAFVLNRK